MKWNQEIFVNKVKWIIDAYCDKNASIFNAKVCQRDAMTRWKKPGYRPSLAVLLEITEKFPVTIDWLLTGMNPTPVKVSGVAEAEAGYKSDMKPHPCAGLEEHCPKFKNILLSDHKVIKDAFLANLHAFDYSISKEKEQDGKIKEQDGKIDNLSQDLGRALKEIRQLREAMQSGRLTDTDAVASSNIGKRET